MAEYKRLRRPQSWKITIHSTNNVAPLASVGRRWTACFPIAAIGSAGFWRTDGWYAQPGEKDRGGGGYPRKYMRRQYGTDNLSRAAGFQI